MVELHGARIILREKRLEDAEQDYIWRSDPELARLDAAGAVDLGGVNTSDCGLNPFGLNRLVGRARNPWNPDHVTGGSSSGSGAAVAARLVFGSMGSDSGGSVRHRHCLRGFRGL